MAADGEPIRDAELLRDPLGGVDALGLRERPRSY
jgi:hypothetical protein